MSALSVVIPVWNDKQCVRECLEALFRSRYRDFEAIVVDDGSTDSSRAVAAEYPCLVLRTQHAGAGAARNFGARHATGGILLFLDSDILVEPDTLERIVSIFEQRPKLDALFGSFSKERVPWNMVSDYKNLVHHYTHQTAELEAATFCGGFGAIRAAGFHKIGGFDSSYRFLEDVEMGMRMNGAGMTVALVRDLQFTHRKRYSLASLIRSDLFGRAIPWTQLILSRRIFRNDLNTRTHNVFSVPISLGIAGGVLLSPVIAVRGKDASIELAAAIAALSLWMTWLNRGFLRFLFRERGAGFASKGLLLLWLGYLYSFVGIAIGIWRCFTLRMELGMIWTSFGRLAKNLRLSKVKQQTLLPTAVPRLSDSDPQ